MMDEEEAYKETAGYPRSTRSRKTMKTKPLPNKTITRKMKTERTEADLEKHIKIGKVTDDEEAATRKHHTKITQQ